MAKLLQKRSDPISIMICKASNDNKQACEMLSKFHVASINFLMKYSMYLYFSFFFLYQYKCTLLCFFPFPLPVQMYSQFCFFFFPLPVQMYSYFALSSFLYQYKCTLTFFSHSFTSTNVLLLCFFYIII